MHTRSCKTLLAVTAVAATGVVLKFSYSVGALPKPEPQPEPPLAKKPLASARNESGSSGEPAVETPTDKGASTEDTANVPMSRDVPTFPAAQSDFNADQVALLMVTGTSEIPSNPEASLAPGDVPLPTAPVVPTVALDGRLDSPQVGVNLVGNAPADAGIVTVPVASIDIPPPASAGLMDSDKPVRIAGASSMTGKETGLLLGIGGTALLVALLAGGGGSHQTTIGGPAPKVPAPDALLTTLIGTMPGIGLAMRRRRLARR